MQPLQCALQQHLHIHAAITLRFASTRCRTQRNRFGPETTAAAPASHRRYFPLCTEKHKVLCSGFDPPQHKPHATFMQPLQCALQQHLHIHAAITLRFASTRCRTQRRNRFDPETAAAAPAAHRRYLSSPPAATSHGKTQGFVLRLLPNTSPMQHSCNHYNAFCSNTYTSMQPLHHDLHPLAYATFMQPVQCLFHYNAFCGNTYTSIKSLTTLHECIVMWLKVSQSHAALHDVLLCDVKSHSLTPPFMMYCYVM